MRQFFTVLSILALAGGLAPEASALRSPASSLLRYSPGNPDTIEVYVIRVAFRYEETDNSLTTGRGSFDSDGDTTGAAYSLDPQGSRGSATYWKEKLAFADQWMQAASNGRVVVTSKVFPTNSGVYTLDKYIIDYNRTSRRKDEKQAEFDDARAQDYLSFVRDAVRKANSSGDSPFQDSLPSGSNRHRVFLIAHAGASRLVDGGSLGSSGADTPGDFMDVFVGSDSWSLLAGVAGAEADSNGIVLDGAAVDTLREVMVVSETASQDGLNWGINGTLVHQICRQAGLPATYDIVKGISRLGYFDAMDFAGYNAGNGFFPVLPSAWLRQYMGWAETKTLTPGSDGTAKDTLWATGSGHSPEILRINITPDEYLLLENRQRTLDSTGALHVTIGDRELTVPVDSFATLFLDSLCKTDGSCTRNPRKARGSVLGISHNDAGLPASGVAVWHVNEWYLRQTLRYGATAFWAGDTFRDHQTGLSLVEADGVLGIGKTFKNALGQSTYDYGSGSDMLPHAMKGKDTVRSLSPYGYGNTASAVGGQSGISLTIRPLPKAKPERTWSSFSGDSVTNWRSQGMIVEVHWGSLEMENSYFPRRLLPGTFRLGLAPLVFPGKKEHAVALLSDNGTVQVLGARGDSLYLSTLEGYDATYEDTQTLLERPSDTMRKPAYSVWGTGPAMGPGIALATQDSSVYSLHARASGNLSGPIRLVRTTLMPLAPDDTYGLSFSRDSVLLTGAALGPVLVGDTVWVASSDSLWSRAAEGSLLPLASAVLPKSLLPTSLAVCDDVDGDGLRDPVLAGHGGVSAVYHTSNGQVTTIAPPAAATGLGELGRETFQIACTDFDRDGTPDAFILGSLGSGWIFTLTDGKAISVPRRYHRGFPIQTDPTKEPYHETSGISLGDLNLDGYPEAVFAGHNAIYAIDRSGVPLMGFPWRMTRGLAEAPLGSDLLVLDVDGDAKPDILAAAPSGLIYAINAQGEPLQQRSQTVSDAGILRTTLFDWPLAAATFPYGDTVPTFHIAAFPADSLPGPELYAQSDGWMMGWRLPVNDDPTRISWLAPGGSSLRDYWLNPALLRVPSDSGGSETIEDAFVFPNPVRSGTAHLRWTLGTDARQVRIRIFDISGLVVFDRKLGEQERGRHQLDDLDLKHLGSDVYTWEVEATFDGSKKRVRNRIAVVR